MNQTISNQNTLNNVVHIISDLHLCASRPDLLQLFNKYMTEYAPENQQLYVLGDLFEAWIGDDCLAPENAANNPNAAMYQSVIDSFKHYAENHGELFFMHGNRDFLLGQDFEKMTKGKLLDEPTFVNWHGKKTALMHGDSLCTDDVAYQQFRDMVRNPAWQSEFLAYPMAKRVEIANSLRQQSKQAQTEKSNEIMDVNQQAVEDFFSEHQIDCLIHGHTHRQATHELIIDGVAKQRVVLSDWGDRGFYLAVTNQGISEVYFC